ncbi:MAG: ATPase, T2SS/T4P/T4SS family [Halobacteriales archaeon]|nr:ATPase, T2SS/T4P/T4SS family [Halobacteriales archaeon]
MDDKETSSEDAETEEDSLDEETETSAEDTSDEMDEALENRDARDMLEPDEDAEEGQNEDVEDPFEDVGGEEPSDETAVGLDDDGGEGIVEAETGTDDDDVFEMGGTEIDGLQEAVDEADKVSGFFEDRSKRSGNVLEEIADQDLEGFFEPEAELEQEFSESKLDTLMSEAKQGVAEYEGMEGYVEHERYWVNKPYAYVAILYSDTQNDYLYHVVEPSLDDYEQAVRKDMEERLRDVLMYEEINDEMDEEDVLETKVKKIISDYGIEVDNDSMHKILYYLKRDYIYDGKIDPILRDPAIEDVSCDGDNVPIFVYHRDYRDLMSNVEFEKQDLDSFVIKLAQKAGKHISVADPLVDASMPDGSRIQMTLGKEVTDRGSTFTIRLFKDEPFTPIDLINFNTFSLEQMAYLWTCIENNKSLIFAGGTASGKTTSMNAVTLFIPPKSKVVSIEDTREVTLPHMNWIPSVTRDSFSDDGSGEVDMYELLRAALRQRPEYLVVGEVRGEEALTLFQAMSTGHTTYSTMHADSVDSAIHRLENPPISVPRSMLKALDIVSIQAQTFVGGDRVRRNLKLVEIIGIDPKTRNIRTDDIFQWNAETDSFVRTGNSTALQDIKRARGWTDEELERELDKRRRVLQYMLDNEISDYEDVSKIIQSFIIDSDRVLNQIDEGKVDLEALEDLKTLNI